MTEKVRIIITGGTGQLGQEFRRLIPRDKYSVHGFSSAELDVTNALELEHKIKKLAPDFLINCAAYTAVDKAEVEMERCNAINAQALKVIGNLANEYDFKVLHFSTDYVFDGSGEEPWTESDETAPISMYGLTKRKGEEALLESECDSLILRVSWLYSEFGTNFPKTINRLLLEKDELNVVNDQISSPTWAKALADFVVKNLLCNAELFTGKIYHYSEEEEASWYDVAVIINEKHGKRLNEVGTHEFVQAAKRPHYSKLDNTLAKDKLGLEPATWQENFREFLKIIQ